MVDFSAESAPLTATARLSVKSVKGKILFINALLGYWVFFCCEIFYHREGGLSRGKSKKVRGTSDGKVIAATIGAEFVAPTNGRLG